MTTPMGVPLPTKLRDAVGRELNEKERILWTGQPDPSRAMRATGCIWLFAIPWTAFSIFWTLMAFGAASQSFADKPWSLLFPAWGLPFIGIGIAMLLSPYGAKRQAQNTAYAITNKRILFVTTGKMTKTQIFQPSLGDIERNEKPDGSGDLIFQKRIGRDSDGDPTTEKIQFMGIPDVRRVEALMMEIFFNDSKPDSPAQTDIMPESGTWGETRWRTNSDR